MSRRRGTCQTIRPDGKPCGKPTSGIVFTRCGDCYRERGAGSGPTLPKPTCATPGCANILSTRKVTHCRECWTKRGKDMPEKPPRLCTICGVTPVSDGSKRGHCEGCRNKRRADATAQIKVATGGDLSDAIRLALKGGAKPLDGLAQILNRTPGQTLDALLEMRRGGVNLHELGGKWSLERIAMSIERERVFTYTSRPDNTYVFGVSSDQHLCSKYAREDVLEDLYDAFQRSGVDRVFNAGNWIDGEDEKNRYDLLVHGFEPQIRYCVERYPRRDGITTYSIWGEDHEGWFSRREAIDVGRFCEGEMRHAGRADWIDLGFVEARVDLVNANTGVKQTLVVMHPGGGSSYAYSYRSQKIVESLSGGEKPAVLLIGHYHKLNLNIIRNVWTAQAGCCFTGNVSVTTQSGRKKIRDVSVGTMVLTDKGRYRPVTRLFKHHHRGDLVSVNYGRRGRPDQTITATPEHPIKIHRNGRDSWVPIADVLVGDGVYVETTVCRCGGRMPFWLRMCKRCNPMHSAEVRNRLSTTRGGKVRTRGGSCGQMHLDRHIVPFCQEKEREGWRMVPVGAGVIPDAIGFKDGRIVAFELEGNGERTRASAHKRAKYDTASINAFVDAVEWVYMKPDAEQPRSPYAIDEQTGFARVSVLYVERYQAKHGRGIAVPVYNLEVEEDHTYVAGRVSVHNCQDQSVFMRKKGLDAHVGGMILTLEQDPQTGAIFRCVADQRIYYDRAYYNDRWSKSRPVVQAPRYVGGVIPVGASV